MFDRSFLHVPSACATVLFTAGVTVLSACASSAARPAADTAPVRVAPPDAPSVSALPAGFDSAFASADTRARAVMFWQQCSATVLRLRAGGTFGAAASAPRQVHCERTTDGVPLGGVFDVDTAYTRARRVTLVRLDGARPRYRDAVDTAGVAVAARLARDVTRAVSPAWRKLGRPFTVVPVVVAGEPRRVEAWVIPQSPRGGNTVVVGGDVGYQRAPDGTLQRIVDRTSTWSLVTVPASGPVRFTTTAAIPAVPELAVARALAERGRAVTIVAARTVSALVAGQDASGARYRWEHAVR